MTRVVVSGACGRMGAAVVGLIGQQTDMELVGGVEAFGHPQLGMPLGGGSVVSDLKAVIDAADCIVEFGPVEAALEHLVLASKKGTPFVLGTTGFSTGQTEDVKRLARSLPMVYAPNFSVGVAVLGRVVEQARRLLGPGYDTEIVELHHRHKRDAPSGTAKKLAEAVRKAAGSGEIRIHSVRAGDIVGEHYVIMANEGERIELVHKASSRLAFAQGVLRAIRFIVGRSNGLWTMEDVLGLAQPPAG
jgi:4-hydroxy-tetrahydrodipicolinate reductase